MIDEARQRELDYYRLLYTRHGYNRAPSVRHDMTDQVVREYGLPGSWLDVGCGLRTIPAPGHLVRVDPAAPGALCVAAHELVDTFGRDSFDVVSAFDVLEHLLPDELDHCLAQMAIVAREGGRLIVSVGTTEGGEWAGRSAHLTVQPAEWWKDKLEGVLGSPAKHVATAKSTSPFFVIDV